MCSYLLLISMSTLCGISCLGWVVGFRCFQHWIPWIHYIIVCLRINYACKMFLLKLFCNVPEGSGSWKYNMYFPADEVARKMEYYIVNRGDERKWNKRTGSSCSTNLKSSRLGCLVFRGSVSTELIGSLLGDPIIPEWIKFLQWLVNGWGCVCWGCFRQWDVMQLLGDWWPEAWRALHQLASVVCRVK